MSFAGPGVRRGDPCESFPTLDIPILYKYLCEDRPFYSNKKPISEAVGHVSVSPYPGRPTSALSGRLGQWV